MKRRTSRDARFADVRDHVLYHLGRMTSDQLRGPLGPYSANDLLRAIALKLSSDEYEYVQRANNLVRGSLEASIDRALQERERYVRTGRRVRSSRR